MADTLKVFLKKQRDINYGDFIGKQGELFFDKDVKDLRISDGSTPGGSRLVFTEVNVSGNSIVRSDTFRSYNDAAAANFKIGANAVVSGGSNYITALTNSEERLRVTSDGQVAIGTITGETNFLTTINGDLSLGEKSGTDNTYIDQKQDGDLHIINSGRTAGGGADPGGAGGVGINRYNNIAGDTSLFRDFVVYNGKNTRILTVDGSRSSIGIGSAIPLANLDVPGTSKFGSVLERVGTAVTYESGTPGKSLLEIDVSKATTHTYTLPNTGHIGIVSFKNLPTDGDQPLATTVTVLFKQGSSDPAAGVGNTLPTTGIGTYCRISPSVDGIKVNTEVNIRGNVGLANTITLSEIANDEDFISFFIKYDGAVNTSSGSYKVYVTKNGSFRAGNIGI